jgi:heme A synthase
MALQRDERTQTVTDRAARNAFVVTMLVIAGMMIYFGSASIASVPIVALKLVLAVAALTYFLSDFWLRRSWS